MKNTNTETNITCPHCGKSIELTQALIRQLEEKYRQDTIMLQVEKEFKVN
jgi:hypothetical protein